MPHNKWIVIVLVPLHVVVIVGKKVCKWFWKLFDLLV